MSKHGKSTRTRTHYVLRHKETGRYFGGMNAKGEIVAQYSSNPDLVVQFTSMTEAAINIMTLDAADYLEVVPV